MGAGGQASGPNSSVSRRPPEAVLLREGLRAVPGLEEARVKRAVRRGLFDRDPEPVRVGRYVIRERLGEGGMGVVYDAYDPDLQRLLAIKVIRAERLAGDAGAERARLAAEAKALAKLSHPNVVQVYDVGDFEGGLYVAMELVDGVSLRDWLHADPGRSWRSIVAVFLAAGRGLAVAHRSGLVHRDFKPANVMVGAHGDVKVLDFGLARETRGREASGDGLPQDGSPTQTGGAAGTPAYMAPEQLSGRADARSDQYAYCVSLYEALYGERPKAFRPDDAPLPTPARASRAPAWLWDVVRRGLSMRPELRFSSMNALLAELSRRRGRRRTGLAVLAVAAVGVLAAASLVPTDEARCDAGPQQLAGRWDAARRTEGRTAFEATGVREAGQAWDEVARDLDAYAEDWARVHRQVCIGSPERELDARMLCLDRGLRQLDAAVGVLLDADRETVVRAREVAHLSPASDCAGSDGVAGETKPDDPRVRAQVEAIESSLAQLGSLRRAGRVLEARDLAAEIAAAATATGHLPTRARAGLLQGRVLRNLSAYDDAIEVLHQAYLDAVTSRQWSVAADAAIVAFRVHCRLRDGAEHRWERAAEAALARLPSDAMQHFRLLYVRGLSYPGSEHDGPEAVRRARTAVDWLDHRGIGGVARGNALVSYASRLAANGRWDEALVPAREGLSLQREAIGPRHPRLIDGLRLIANIQVFLGNLGKAEEPLRQAVEITEAARGETWGLSRALDSLATVQRMQGKLDTSLETSQRALEILRRVLPPEHPDLAAGMSRMAGTLTFMGRYDDAIALFNEAWVVFEAAYPEGDLLVAGHLNDAGAAFELRGDFEAALAKYERARVELGRVRQAESIDATIVWFNLGTVNYALEDYERSRRSLERARDLQVRLLGAEHHEVGTTLAALGRTLAALGRVEEARKTFERALTIHAAEPDVEPHELADTRLWFAQFLASHGDGPRARDLAGEAARTFAKLGMKDRQREVETWIEDRFAGRP